jgi:hypothetical protein
MTPLDDCRRRGMVMESTDTIDPGIVHRVRFSKFVGAVVLYSAVNQRLDERRRSLFAEVIEKRNENAQQLVAVRRTSDHRRRCSDHRPRQDPRLQPIYAHAPPVSSGTHSQPFTVGADLGSQIAYGSTLSRSTPEAITA